MSTSRDSLIGLPLSIDSSTAISRARSWMIRAIRKRYLPRSAPLIRDQTRVYARRAALTASVDVGLVGLGDLGEHLLGGRARSS